MKTLPGENWPDLSGYEEARAVGPPKYSVDTETWARLTPGQKQASLLADALDYKRELISVAKSYPVCPDNAGIHSLFLKASDSIIDQVLQIEANALHRPASDEIEKLFEERQQHALREIERLTRGEAGQDPIGDK